MKPSLQANVFVLLGVACMIATLFQKLLGLPDWTGFVTPLLGAIFIGCAVWVTRRARKRAEVSITQPTPQQYNRRVRLLLICVITGSLTSPFYLPYTGVTLPFYQLVICSLVSCGFCITIVLFSAAVIDRRSNYAMQSTNGRRTAEISMTQISPPAATRGKSGI